MRKIAIALSCLLFSVSLSISSAFKERSAFAESSTKGACVMELNTRRVLYEYRGDIRLPMASTTKILTAATVLSLCDDLEKKVVIPPEAEGVEGSSVYLKQGEEYSVKDLLYGLMLRSGNDCAAALAYYCSGGIGNFSAKMNETAEKAGALDSNFKNPHGLPCDGHYTTARDLTAIACYAMQNPIFRQIVSTKYYEPCQWKNKNKMLYNYDGAIGVKTGYTKQAGRCLVSAAERGGMTLVCTVLSCSDMYEHSAALLNDAFQSYDYVSVVEKGAEYPVLIKGKEVRGTVMETYAYPLLKAEREHLEYAVKPLSKGKKIEKGEEIIGQLEISLSKRLLFSTNLYKL